MFRVNETKCMFSSKEILRILDCKACEVKDFEITEVSVDSRSVNKPESTLFFALKGINHDGHDYVEKLYEQGVRNFVVTGLRADFLPLSGANFFVVDEVLPALQQLAAWYRGQMKAEVVGITGSNGKTIVKEWLYQLLSDEPGIYLEGQYGIRIENELVCRKGEVNMYGQFMHFEPLTFAPIDLDAVDVDELSATDKKRLNAYHQLVYDKISPYLTDDERKWLKIYTRAV